MVFAHNDDMGLGAIEAIEAAGKMPGKDIKIVTIDAVKDGMTALADGKINYIVECNPLLGPQLMELAKKVVAGEQVPDACRHRGDDFTQDAGQGSSCRAASTERRRPLNVVRRPRTAAARHPTRAWQTKHRKDTKDERDRSGRRDDRHQLLDSPGSRRSTASTSASSKARSTP